MTPGPKREVHKLEALDALQSNAPSLGGANVVTHFEMNFQLFKVKNRSEY